MATMLEQFKIDVDTGLSGDCKSLSSKYFYDSKGDALFQRIMHMPEYYLTKAELEIFKEQSDAISDALLGDANELDVIELGAGDGSKVVHLLTALKRKVAFEFKPIDISANALSILEANLHRSAPDIPVVSIQGEYFSSLDHIGGGSKPKVVLFLGSNIGNLTDEQAAEFMKNIDNCLSQGDKVLLGVDTNKDARSVINAYDDPQGITRDFNLNLLDRINNELGADFDLDQFDHAPIYVEEQRTAVSYLMSRRNQKVYIESLDKTYQFNENEKIHTEISRKYDQQDLENLLEKTNLRINSTFTDSQNRFTDFILMKI